MKNQRQNTMVTINSEDEIPVFASEEEEAKFWDTHELGDEMLAKMQSIPEGILPPSRPRTRSVAIRFDEDTIQRVKSLAQQRHKSYQTLLKEFVLERLCEEEKREGLRR